MVLTDDDNNDVKNEHYLAGVLSLSSGADHGAVDDAAPISPAAGGAADEGHDHLLQGRADRTAL